MLRVVIDTNILISALINPQGYPAQVLNAFYRQQFRLVTSNPLLAELSIVFSRRQIVRHSTDIGRQSLELLILMRNTADIVALGDFDSVCRDPKDDVVIATVIQGGADALVTRDDDLKSDSDVARYLELSGRQVFSIARFPDVLRSNEPGG